MVLEIAAGRLPAPYIGAHLYSRSAIIGVVLGGFSLRNWLEWRDVTISLAEVGTPLSALPILHDDSVPVERLLSGLIFTELGC
jgi:hypothetical protein